MGRVPKGSDEGVGEVVGFTGRAGVFPVVEVRVSRSDRASKPLAMLPELCAGFGRVAGSVPKGSDEHLGGAVGFAGRAAVPTPLSWCSVTSILHTPRIEFPLSTVRM